MTKFSSDMFNEIRNSITITKRRHDYMRSKVILDYNENESFVDISNQMSV